MTQHKTPNLQKHQEDSKLEIPVGEGSKDVMLVTYEFRLAFKEKTTIYKNYIWDFWKIYLQKFSKE